MDPHTIPGPFLSVPDTAWRIALSLAGIELLLHVLATAGLLRRRRGPYLPWLAVLLVELISDVAALGARYLARVTGADQDGPPRSRSPDDEPDDEPN